jgi:hypothetical protein
MGTIDLVFESLPFRVRREVLGDEVLHQLYYKQHQLKTWRTHAVVPEAEVITYFQDWLAGKHAGPYECLGGPLDGEQVQDLGQAFKSSDESGRHVLDGEYRRSGMLYLWEEPAE